MKEILNYLFSHKSLTKENAKTVLTNIATGKYSDAEIASFITVYLMRSVTVDELSGFRDALLDLCTPVDLKDFNTIDVCGTGGDEKNTFNISTATGFVLAGAGLKVAKHGNYSISSSCGSSNVLEYYGLKFTTDNDLLRKQIDKAGICFLHAPLFNPAMKNVAPVRKSLRVKTFFNMLGPMVNPSRPKNQVVGVFNLEIARLYNYIYQQSDKNYHIIFGLDGYDEISLTSDFKIFSRNYEQTVSPADLNMKKNNPEEIYGGKTVEEAARIFLQVLEGTATQAQLNTVIANAVYGIRCFYPEKSIAECIEIATESIKSKKAFNAFKTLITLQ